MIDFAINVLLVDDKKENIYSLQTLLEGLGEITFLHATSGKEALKISLKEDIALILLDVQMPEMDGYEVAHILKQNKSTENIPVIFVTAINQDASYIMEGYSKGAFDYLFKPLNPDITRAKVQAFIKMYEQQKINESLAVLVNNSQDVMCILEAENLQILTANPALHETVGFSKDQMKHVFFTDLLLLSEDASEMRIEMKKALISKKNEYKNEVQLKSALDDEPKWICWDFVFSGGKWYGSGKDITGRKKVEHALNQVNVDLTKAHEDLLKLNNELEKRVSERTRELSTAKDRFEAVALATNDTLWDWNLYTNEIWWSEGIKTIYGYTDPELESGINSKFNKIHPDDADKVMKEIQQLVNSGKNHWSGEYRFRKENGNYAYILDRSYVIYDENKKPSRIVGSMFDMSDIKKSQHQLNLINTELSNKNEELSRINKDMDNFIYTASHDLKAPVSNIEGLIISLDDIITPEAKGEMYQSIVSMIHLSIERFKNTLRDLSEIAKADGDNGQDVEETSLEEMLEEVKASIMTQIEESGARISHFFEEPTVRFSKKNLRSIIYNLLSNAIKYKDFQRVPVINIKSRCIDGSYVQLLVEDNGLGIKEEDKEKVFTMFKRLHNHVEGTGVGMSIVKRIIDNSGGRIELDSKVGQGSVFTVYFKK